MGKIYELYEINKINDEYLKNIRWLVTEITKPHL